MVNISSTRHIRIRPLSWKNDICLRVNVFKDNGSGGFTGKENNLFLLLYIYILRAHSCHVWYLAGPTWELPNERDRPIMSPRVVSFASYYSLVEFVESIKTVL